MNNLELQNLLTPSQWQIRTFYYAANTNKYVYIFYFSKTQLDDSHFIFDRKKLLFLSVKDVPSWITLSKGFFGQWKFTYSLFLNLILTKSDKKILNKFILNEIRIKYLSNPN